MYNRDFFQARIYDLNQENTYILSDLAKSDSNILIATIVYEMGVYNHWVKVIIHYGPSRNIEAYHHKNGGRRNAPNLCTVVILYSSFMWGFFFVFYLFISSY